MSKVKLITYHDVTITKAKLHVYGNGILTVNINFNINGKDTTFGDMALHLAPGWKHYSKTSIAGDYIYKCMLAANADSWDKIVGKRIHVKMEDDTPIAIRGYVHKEWFNPKEEYSKSKPS